MGGKGFESDRAVRCVLTAGTELGVTRGDKNTAHKPPLSIQNILRDKSKPPLGHFNLSGNLEITVFPTYMSVYERLSVLETAAYTGPKPAPLPLLTPALAKGTPGVNL